MWHFKKNVDYISGALCAAIYDQNTGNLYHISAKARRFIELLIFDKQEINDYQNNPFFLTLLRFNLISNTDTIDDSMTSYEDHESKIDFAWIEITSKCNLKCIHCYNGTSSNNSIMNFDDFTIVVDALRRYGIKRVQIIGGEPFILGNKLKDYLCYLSKDNYFSIEIFTNATLITKEWASFLHENNIRVAISMYSYNQSDHEYVTKVKGSYLKTYAGIQLLKDASVPYRVANVLMDNVSLGECNTELFKLSCKKDVVRMSGRASFELLNPALIKLKLITKTTFQKKYRADFYRSALHFHNCFKSKILISPDLKVYPCVMERRICHGNLKDNDLNQIIQSSLQRLNKDKIQVCKDCEYRYHCFDCRPNSLEASYETKPWYCTYDPYSGKWADENEFIENLYRKYKIDFQAVEQ